jgi:hypothetical protein
MKKHYVIIGIVALSALFFIISIIKNSSEEEEISKPTNPSTLNERMEKMGRSPWNEENYEALMNEIIGLASDHQISKSELDSYRNTLNINLQKSLALSYKKSLNESCYEVGLKKVNQMSKKITNPIPELDIQKQYNQKFQIALNYKARLMTLLSKQYNENESNNLIQNFNNAIANYPFYNCDKIQKLKYKIKQELDEIKNFDADYNIKVKNQEDFDYFDKDLNQENFYKLQKYAHYKNEYETLKQQ